MGRFSRSMAVLAAGRIDSQHDHIVRLTLATLGGSPSGFGRRIDCKSGIDSTCAKVGDEGAMRNRPLFVK